MKLIKLSETHYIVVDDSEIKEGDWYIDDANNIRRSITSDKDYCVSRKDYKKITRSTRPLSEECIRCNGYCEQCVDGTKPLSLSEVEEVISRL